MYQVLENGKAADSSVYLLCGSNNSIFQSFGEAQKYTAKWLGARFTDCIPQQPDEKIEYNGRGDTIEIKSLPRPEVTTLYEALKGKTIVNVYKQPNAVFEPHIKPGIVMIELNDGTEIIVYDGIVGKFDNINSVMGMGE